MLETPEEIHGLLSLNVQASFYIHLRKQIKKLRVMGLLS